MLERIVFNRNNFYRLITISNRLKFDYIEDFSSLDSKKIIVAHDGSDTVNIQCSLTKKVKKGEAIVFGYVGSLYPGRGVELVIQLAGLFPENEFSIYGGTKCEIELISKANKIKNLKFHGHVEYSKISRAYKSFDVALAPYKRKVYTSFKSSETSKWMSPLKIFEYMSFKKLIIASDLPVLKEILAHNKNSLLCPPDDINCWQKTIKKIIDEPSKYQRIVDQSAKDLAKYYTWSARAKKILEI
jgi:glycosyltransferase involved in cell wall biosynthesis